MLSDYLGFFFKVIYTEAKHKTEGSWLKNWKWHEMLVQFFSPNQTHVAVPGYGEGIELLELYSTAYSLINPVISPFSSSPPLPPPAPPPTSSPLPPPAPPFPPPTSPSLYTIRPHPISLYMHIEMFPLRYIGNIDRYVDYSTSMYFV